LRKEIQMARENQKRIHIGRRDFIKTMTLAGMAATLPGSALAARSSAGAIHPRPAGGKKNLLCLSNNPPAHEKFIESIRSIPGTGLQVSSIKVNYQNPEEIVRTVHEQDMDILLLILPRMTFSFGKLCDSMGDLDIPVIVLTTNPELIPIDANLSASLRGNGANVTFAISQAQALERVRIAASPGILEGRRAVLYGRPFDSTTVTAHNLNEDLVYRRTGVKIQFRPLEELAALYREVDAGDALREMERWKRDAVKVIGVSDKTIVDACRLYVLLRSIVEKEGLSAVSIDCLGFTLSPNPILPYPCLAFARLRDEGVTAACEADVCSMLSSMFLEEISRKPSFMCNLMSVDPLDSKITVSHCVAPLKLNGPDAEQMRYRLHDYHGSGRGAVPEVEFPTHGQVLTGGFSKDLKSFALWPGRIQSQVMDTDRAQSRRGFMNNVCANTMDVKIRDVERFLQNIPGLHQIMVLGNYTRAVEDALIGMNGTLVGPLNFAPLTA
jgi:L-fucose isomerase-like protein